MYEIRIRVTHSEYFDSADNKYIPTILYFCLSVLKILCANLIRKSWALTDHFYGNRQFFVL